MAHQLTGTAGAITIPAASLLAGAGFAPNLYFWIDRLGNLTSTGQATLAANVSLVAPTDQAIIECSLDQAVEMFVQHGALTSAAGGTIAVAEIMPDFPAVPAFGGAPIVVGTPTSQALAATAESLRTSVVSPYTGPRLIKIALAILFTTIPTAGTGIKIQLYGHRDGQERQRG